MKNATPNLPQTAATESIKPTEPTLEDILPNAHDDAPDGLALLIQHDIDHDPGFAEAWAPIAVVRRILDERRRLGLSQDEVAGRMGLVRTAVAKLENDPGTVAFGRIMAYAQALGVEIEVKASKQKPQPAAMGRGRPIRAVPPPSSEAYKIASAKSSVVARKSGETLSKKPASKKAEA